MSRLRVVDPGLLSSIQDQGRPAATAFAFPAGGAADMRSFNALNSLLLNPPTSACIEITLAGAALAFEGDMRFALTGAPADAHLESAEGIRTPIVRGTVHEAGSGDTLRIAHTRSGARMYFGVAGGIESPIVLGSQSVHTPSGIPAGLLRRGQAIPIGVPRAIPDIGASIPVHKCVCIEETVFRPFLRVTPGPHAARFPTDVPTRFAAAEWTVSSESSRAGVRLRCDQAIPAPSTSMLTEPMGPGFIQVPPSGQPIILGRDHPTTGGYPVLASIISADLDAVGQLRPGQSLRFQWVTIAEARTAWMSSQESLGA